MIGSRKVKQENFQILPWRFESVVNMSVYYYCQCKCILIQSRSIELGYLSVRKINCPAFSETQYRRLQLAKSAMNDIYIYKDNDINKSSTRFPKSECYF